MQTARLIVTFKKPSAAKAAAPANEPYGDELARFAAADPRWHDAIELASARLTDRARYTLGVALSGLEAGPAPRLMSCDFAPDGPDAIARECVHMDSRILSGLDLLTSARLGLGTDEVAAVQGIVSAVHRLLRIAKTRP